MRTIIAADQTEYGGLPSLIDTLVDQGTLTSSNPRNWLGANGVEMRQLNGVNGFDRFSVEFARAQHFKAFAMLFFQGPFTIAIEHQSGAITFLSTDPEILSEGAPTSLGGDTAIVPISQFSSMETEDVIDVLEGPVPEAQETGYMSCGRSEGDFVFSNRDPSGSSAKRFNLFFLKEPNEANRFMCDILKLHEYEVKSGDYEYYVGYNEDAGIDVVLEEYPLIQGNYWISRISVEECGDDERSKIIAFLTSKIGEAKGSGQVYLEMDNDATSNQIPVWPVSVKGDELVMGNLTELEIDSFEPD